MNSGDRLRVRFSDTPNGLNVKIQDLTTGAFGQMTASKANGFGQVKYAPHRQLLQVDPVQLPPDVQDLDREDPSDLGRGFVQHRVGHRDRPLPELHRAQEDPGDGVRSASERHAHDVSKGQQGDGGPAGRRRRLLLLPGFGGPQITKLPAAHSQIPASTASPTRSSGQTATQSCTRLRSRSLAPRRVRTTTSSTARSRSRPTYRQSRARPATPSPARAALAFPPPIRASRPRSIRSTRRPTPQMVVSGSSVTTSRAKSITTAAAPSTDPCSARPTRRRAARTTSTSSTTTSRSG